MAVSNAIDNSALLFVDAIVQVKVKTGASGVATTGYFNVWLIRSADGGTTYSDNADVLLGSVVANANATTYTRDFNAGVLGSSFKIAVENRTGAALDSTAGSHLVQFAGIRYNVA